MDPTETLLGSSQDPIGTETSSGTRLGFSWDSTKPGQDILIFKSLI
jgi:hypothetical protein